jgi:hypothetical protein
MNGRLPKPAPYSNREGAPLKLTVPADKLAPPGISGELHTVQYERSSPDETGEDRLRDEEERDFEVHIVLMRDSGFERDIRTEAEPGDGTSFFQLPTGVDRMIIQNPAGEFSFVVNERREYSGISARCRARSSREARTIVLRAVSPVIDHLAYFANTPLILGNVTCTDRKNGVVAVGYTSPYRMVVVSAGQMAFPSDLIPIYALYREAKSAPSPFYRFLCYYKILEGIYNTLRSGVFETARAKGITLVREKELIPEHPELRLFQASPSLPG